MLAPAAWGNVGGDDEGAVVRCPGGGNHLAVAHRNPIRMGSVNEDEVDAFCGMIGAKSRCDMSERGGKSRSNGEKRVLHLTSPELLNRTEENMSDGAGVWEGVHSARSCLLEDAESVDALGEGDVFVIGERRVWIAVGAAVEADVFHHRLAV